MNDIQDNKEQHIEHKKEHEGLDSQGHFKMENAPIPEIKEIPVRDEKLITEELKRELDLMEADEIAKGGIQKAKEKIEFLDEKEKIEHLLQLARDKGLVYAISVARKMNEPYLLDVLHDTLAREGFYKDFLPGSKKNDDDN